MDRITKSLLDEFSRDSGIESLPEDKRFEHFASYLAVSRYHSESCDTSDIVTGSGGDIGIDAIAVLINGTLVTDAELVEQLADTNGSFDVAFIFVQAERSSSFDTSKIGQFGFGVLDFFKEAPTLPQNSAVKEFSAIMTAIYERSSKFKRGNPVCRLFYVTTGKWVGDQNLEVRRQSVIEDLQNLRLFQDVEFVPVDADSIQKLYSQTKNAISREFAFPERNVIPEILGVSEAYLGLVAANEFLSLIQDENGDIIKSLFYDNVRDFQDFNLVNTGIRDTLGSDSLKARFVLMNNGITIIAKTMRLKGNKIYIEDYQVVNGCQTSHILFDQRDKLDESVMVPLRLIATQDENVIGSIIKATNRQTEVKEEQLLALSDFQKKLEAFFLTYENGKRLFYERRSRQYNNVAGVEKTRVVTPSNLIRAYASVFLEEPHRTTRNYKLLLDRVGKNIFVEDHRLEPYYVSAYALYRLEFLFRNQTIDSKFRAARYHILLAFRLLSVSDPLPRPNSHEMQRYCEKMLEVLWDIGFSEQTFVRAAQEVDQVAQGNFHRDHIRTQPFTESLQKHLAPKNSNNA